MIIIDYVLATVLDQNVLMLLVDKLDDFKIDHIQLEKLTYKHVQLLFLKNLTSYIMNLHPPAPRR